VPQIKVMLAGSTTLIRSVQVHRYDLHAITSAADENSPTPGIVTTG
jgi:hypothetical protein